MDETLISFVVPAHTSNAPHLHRFLRSLTYQTDMRFEVVVGADGGDPGGVLAAVAAGPWPFPVRVVDAPRPKGDFPHRNHARNAAVAAAVGTWAWVADADFVWCRVAVAHALAVLEAHQAQGELIALTPCLRRIAEDADVFLGLTAEWVAGDGRNVEALVGSMRTDTGEFSGFGNLYAPDDEPRVAEPRVAEGFPVVRLDVIRALGGFDERFMRWGGNKIEFTFRLGNLGAEGLAYRVLTSVAAWHQPHPQDPNKPPEDVHRLANADLYRQVQAEVRGGAAWWNGQRTEVQRIAVSLRIAATPRREEPERRRRRRVGFVVVTDHRKGIVRDVQLLEACLRGGPVRHLGDDDPEVVRYTVANPRTFAASAGPSVEGLSWRAFLERVDVVVITELLPLVAINAALAAKVDVVLIPNADWCEIDGDPQAWLDAVRPLARLRGVQVWGKASHILRAMQEAGIRCVGMPWIALDRVVRFRVRPEGRPVSFFASIGLGGFEGRRGVDIIVRAWAALRAAGVGPDRATLTVKSAVPLESIAGPDLGPVPDDIAVVVADWTREQIVASWAAHDVVLYPTRWDGFGLSLSEALNAGCPVIVPDGAPWRDQVRDGENGLVIDAKRTGSMHLAPRYEVDPDVLAHAMRRLVDDRALLKAMTAPHAAEREAHQHAMRMHVRARLLGEASPFAVVVGERMAQRARDARDALAHHGFDVFGVGVDELATAPPESNVDLAVVTVPVDAVAISRLRGIIGPGTPAVYLDPVPGPLDPPDFVVPAEVVDVAAVASAVYEVSRPAVPASRPYDHLEVAPMSPTEPPAATAALWKRLSRHVASRIKPHDRRILDFGCGAGAFVEYLSRDGREVVGVDLSPTAIAAARARHPTVDFRAIVPGAPLPFPDGTFDAVWCCRTLQHVGAGDFDRIAGELRRVLRPRGLVFLFENTHPAGRSTSAAYSAQVTPRREVTYRTTFPGVVEVESWRVVGEVHSFMAGRIC